MHVHVHVHVLDANTLGAVTRTTTGFLSNLVQRKGLGGPTFFFIILLFILVLHSAKGRFSMATSDTSRYNTTFIFAWEEVEY